MKREFGRPAASGPFRGRVHPDLEPSIAEVLGRCRELCADPAAEVLLAGRNLVVAASVADAGGARREVVVKRFGVRGPHRLKTLVVPSKALKAWRGAAACLEAGVATPLPLLVLERRRRGTVVEGYFVSERVRGVREVRGLFRGLEGEDLRRLLSGLAAWLRGVHDRGLLHRDLSDGNVLVAGDPAAPGFLLVDTNRVRRRPNPSRFARMRNLVRLGIPAAERDRFLDAYFAPAPVPPSARFAYRRMKSAYAGFLAAKKALRLRAIARRLGLQ